MSAFPGPDPINRVVRPFAPLCTCPDDSATICSNSCPIHGGWDDPEDVE